MPSFFSKMISNTGHNSYTIILRRTVKTFLNQWEKGEVQSHPCLQNKFKTNLGFLFHKEQAEDLNN